MTGPYESYDTGAIENAATPQPPVEGVDYVIDVVNTMDGPKEMTIRRARP